MPKQRELSRRILDALECIGPKGEVKVGEWIRRSAISWTNQYNKESLSYGNHQGHDLEFWRMFMRQCHILGLVDYKLQSMIKRNGHYSVMGVLCPLPEGNLHLTENKPLSLPCKVVTVKPTTYTTASCSFSPPLDCEKSKRKREGKGSNILTVVRKLMKCPENLKSIKSKQDYQFLGSFEHPSPQQLFFIPDCSKLEQRSLTNPHFIWADIQLSKGQLNKDRLIKVEMIDKDGNKKGED